LYFNEFWNTYEPMGVNTDKSGLLTLEEIKQLKNDFTDITKIPPNDDERDFGVAHGHLNPDYYIDNRAEGQFMLEQVIKFIEVPGNKVENGPKLTREQWRGGYPSAVDTEWRASSVGADAVNQGLTSLCKGRGGEVGGGGGNGGCDEALQLVWGKGQRKIRAQELKESYLSGQ
jgi:hypothetical protein